MKVMKIVFAALALALMTGCVSSGQYGQYSSYKDRQAQRQCSISADKQAQNAYIKRESGVRFAKSNAEVQKAQQTFQKRIASIKESRDNCLVNNQRRDFEEKLRRTTTRNYNRSYY